MIHLGAIKPQELSVMDVSMHWSTTIRKVILHFILTRQNGLVNLKLPNHYYPEKGIDKLYFFNEKLQCEELFQY